MTVLNQRLNGGFGQCTTTVMRDPTISLRDKALYAYLSTFADSRNNQLRVSVYKMAAELNVSKITVIRSLKALEDSNIIKRMSIGKGKSKVTILLK
jgi:DNA-binding Lrp family transcriptional regulator